MRMTTPLLFRIKKNYIKNHSIYIVTGWEVTSFCGVQVMSAGFPLFSITCLTPVGQVNAINASDPAEFAKSLLSYPEKLLFPKHRVFTIWTIRFYFVRYLPATLNTWDQSQPWRISPQTIFPSALLHIWVSLSILPDTISVTPSYEVV